MFIIHYAKLQTYELLQSYGFIESTDTPVMVFSNL